jgi:hypothetical protein
MELKNKFTTILTIAVLCAIITVAVAEISIPDRPLNYVVDLAGVIDASTEAGLNRYLMELEQKTTAQMLLIINGNWVRKAKTTGSLYWSLSMTGNTGLKSATDLRECCRTALRGVSAHSILSLLSKKVIIQPALQPPH